jgi:hypothetical protein
MESRNDVAIGLNDTEATGLVVKINTATVYLLKKNGSFPFHIFQK